MEGGRSWRPRCQTGRCARGAHVRPELRRGGPTRAAPHSLEASRQGAGGLGRCAVVWDTKGEAEVVDHGGHQRATHDATGDEGREREPKRRAEAQTAASDSCGGLPP